MRLGTVLGCAACLTIGLAVPSIAQAVVYVFSDDVFDDADWTLFELVDETPNDSAVFIGNQNLTGGNPGAYRRVVNELNTPTASLIVSGHLRQGATFDPGEDGSFLSMSISLDGISEANNPAEAVQYGLLVEQNGAYFTVSLPQVLNEVGWQNRSLTGIGQSQFDAVDDVSVLDLSDSGAVVSIGFFALNGTFGEPSTNVGGVDNWSVTIEATDPPASVPTGSWSMRLLMVALLLTTAAIPLARRIQPAR